MKSIRGLFTLSMRKELKEERSGALLNMTKDLAKLVVVFSDQLILPYKL